MGQVIDLNNYKEEKAYRDFYEDSEIQEELINEKWNVKEE